MARLKKEKEEKPGKVSIKDLRGIINKKAGVEVAYDLQEENPTSVIDWIPTGSRWLDSIVAKGMMSGIPVGKIVEIAGLEASGKSYMAAQIAANAQKKGFDVVYFDSESALDPSFLTLAGCDLESLVYVQATTVEFVFETIEDLLANNENRMLFIWDSFANTACKADLEATVNVGGPPKAPHIATMGMKKLTIPIANGQSTLLVLNQLKTNINVSNPNDMLVNPYFAPGGKALPYAYSLRIWLTGRKAKASYVMDANGFRIGSEVKAKLKKSRFGTEGRECSFKILWGNDQVSIQDEESWLEAIRTSDRFKGGAWKEIKLNDGSIAKFQEAGWLDKLKEPKFREAVLEIMDEELIHKFMNKTGKASAYYSLDGEEETVPVQADNEIEV